MIRTDTVQNKTELFSPGWWGSVGWSVVWFTKGCKVRFPVRVHKEATDCCFSLMLMFLSFSLLLFL